ncbi:alpha-N-acetylgalactosaminide alpha-2,6-sialyltransferase 1-like [Osmerus eperlanus]|uniref:alpha-N-acetylgalactosaminide alpha-2,6-sialyltransferase 1-like n=1 Tax=Osmerus eperlanus TaxID=29151 RepID=UPI002E11C0E2
MTFQHYRIMYLLVRGLVACSIFYWFLGHISRYSRVRHSPPIESTTIPEIASTSDTSNYIKTNPTIQTGNTLTSGRQTRRPSKPTASAHKETLMPILFKKDFSKVPVWDFEEIYIQDIQTRQTTCPRSLQHTEDSGFKHAFIPNVQLFMHKDHLNVSEWNRLAHFNNPFGFMEYNYSEVKAAVDRIPEDSIPFMAQGDPTRCVRCAVVANGGILNGSGMGKEIDAHDYVFRMNGAVIQGFEEDVGKRTSVYVHTAFSITASPLLFKDFGYKSVPHDEGIKYVMIPEGLADYQWLDGLFAKTAISSGLYQSIQPWTYYAGQFDERRFYVLHPDFLRYIRNRFLKSEFLNEENWAIVRPSNGAITLFLALHTCDVVDAYGFITEDHSKYSNYYFERHKKTSIIFFVNHDYNLEMKTWKRLHDAKIIILYQRREESGRGTEK